MPFIRKKKTPTFPEKSGKIGVSKLKKTSQYKPNLPAKIFYGFLTPAGLLTQGSSYSPAFPTRLAGQWRQGAFVLHHSCGAVADFHRLPVTGIKIFRRLFPRAFLRYGKQPIYVKDVIDG